MYNNYVDFKDRNGKWVKMFRYQGKTYKSAAYSTWTGMMGRLRSKKPHYCGCCVSDNFKMFNYFVEWYRQQVGSYCKDFALDKDILVSGNRLYSENTCVLVPTSLNSFFSHAPTKSTNFPVGVSFHKNAKSFQANIRIDSIKKHLGCFKSADQASAAYIIAKELEVSRWITRLKDGEFTVDPRVIKSLEMWDYNEYVKKPLLS